MRLDIRYTTRFRYAGRVSESQNELRACPANDQHQQLVHYHVTSLPSSRVASYVDYWGTRVDTFGVRAPHDLLEVVAEATVETSPPPERPEPVPIAALTDQRVRDSHLEFLQRSPHVDWGEKVADAARTCAAEAGDDAVALTMGIHDRVAALEYRPGETYVGVGVDEVFASGRGVCQDFAHLALAMYREVGLPARYVSGYFFSRDDASGPVESSGPAESSRPAEPSRPADGGLSHDDEVEVETHAWVEVAIPRWGWLALDPTNSQPVGERHVTIGRGRDYDDVAPFRGVFSGRKEHDLEVAVTMRRLAREPLAGMPGSGLRHVAQQQEQQQQ